MTVRAIRPVKSVDNLAPEIMGVVADMWESYHPEHIAEKVNARFGRWGADALTATHVWNIAQILRRIDIDQS